MVAALFVLIAALSGWAGFSSGNWGYLVAALGFLALAPSSWYSPFAFGKPRTQSSGSTRPQPRWAGPLSVVGGVLILVGIILRWLLP